MSYTFRKAVTSEAKPLIGLYAESGGGKTKSALLLAKGFTGDMAKVGMIETESGRGEAWAEDPEVGGYNVLSIREDFSPTAYGKAIGAAETAGIECLIVDSASHEWEGLHGVLGMAAENQAKGLKGPLVWQKPKMDHAREFMLRLTQTPIPLVIVCMRAKYPMYQIKEGHIAAWKKAGGTGKPPTLGDWARSEQLDPKQSEDILYEMFIHGWLDKERHAFHGTKYTMDILRNVFIDNEPITIDTGVRLKAWAAGKNRVPAPAGFPPGAQADAAAPTISVDQAIELADLFASKGWNKAKWLAKHGITSFEQVSRDLYDQAKAAP